MHRKKRTFSLITSIAVLLLALSLTSCSPAPRVYEGPVKKKTSVKLRGEKEYLVFFEDEKPGWAIPGSASSSWVSAGGYPTLDRIVALYDEMGNTIPNMISSGKLHAYYWLFLSFGKCGITVARFRLEGEATRSVEVHVNLDAYREFANLYNERHNGTSVGAEDTFDAWAPRQPNKIVIREAGQVSSWKTMQFVWIVIAMIAVIAIIAYAIYKGKRKRQETNQ